MPCCVNCSHQGCVGNDGSLLRVCRCCLDPGRPQAVQRSALVATARAGLCFGFPWEAQPEPERQQSEELDGSAKGKCCNVRANIFIAHNMAGSLCHHHKDWCGTSALAFSRRFCLLLWLLCLLLRLSFQPLD